MQIVGQKLEGVGNHAIKLKAVISDPRKQPFCGQKICGACRFLQRHVVLEQADHHFVNQRRKFTFAIRCVTLLNCPCP